MGYDPDEIVKYYFILIDGRNGKQVHAFTQNKDLAKFYLDFHNSDVFSLKVISDKRRFINEILDENNNSSIGIMNIRIRNPDAKKKDKPFKTIQIPITEFESEFLNSETDEFMASRIGYSQLNEVIPLLKVKYQRALKDILLFDVIRKVVHHEKSSKLDMIALDQLNIMIQSFPDHFGKD